jgi:hypothetical protein
VTLHDVAGLALSLALLAALLLGTRPPTSGA